MQSKSLPCPVRRAVALGGLTAMLAAPTWSCLAADATAPAEAAPSPAKPKTIHLVYVDSELRTPGLTTPERDETLVDYKYYDITRHIKERAPLVFAANALVGDTTVVEAPGPDGLPGFDFPAGDPVIVLSPVSYAKQRKMLQTWAIVTFAVTPFETAPVDAATAKPVKHQLGMTLGPDPVLGVLRINRLDASLVDWLLTQTLDIAASKGVLALPQAKAVRPKA